MYKVWALLDSSSTKTLVSQAILEQMSQIKAFERPTTMVFCRISPQYNKYYGILLELNFQLANHLVGNVTAAVISSNKPYLIIG